MTIKKQAVTTSLSGVWVNKILTGIEDITGVRTGWAYKTETDADGVTTCTFTAVGWGAQASFSWNPVEAQKFDGDWSDVIIQQLANRITEVQP